MIVIFFVTFAEFFRGYGKVLTAMQGRIYSRLIHILFDYRPGSTNLYYENNLDCLWTIVGKNNNIIMLMFMSMDIELSHGCQYDYIYVSGTLDYSTYVTY